MSRRELDYFVRHFSSQPVLSNRSIPSCFYRGCQVAILALLLGGRPLSGFSQITDLHGRLQDTVLKRDCSQPLIRRRRKEGSVLDSSRSRHDGTFSFNSKIPA